MTEILTNPAIQHDNKNIRLYWNIGQRAFVVIVTNTDDNKRVTRKDNGILFYSSNTDINNTEKLKAMFTREAMGRLNAFFNISIDLKQAQQLANALLNFNDNDGILGRKKEAHEVLGELNNKEFAHIFQEVQKEVEQGATAKELEDNQATESSSKPKNNVKSNKNDTPTYIVTDYINLYHTNELYNIANGLEDQQDIIIDYQQFKAYNPFLGKQLIEDPTEVLEIMTNTIMQIIHKKGNPYATAMEDNQIVVTKDNFNIKFDNLELTPTNKLLANKIGQMVQTEGIIKGVLEPTFYYTKIVYQCRKCFRLQEVEQPRIGTMLEPTICPECGGRDFRPMEEQSTAKDLKYIRLQEPTDDLSTDERPRNILVCLTGNLTYNIINGQRVKITGILDGNRNDDGTSKFILNANHVVKLEDQQIEITAEDEAQILELAKDPEILDILVNSFAPNLIMAPEIKLALLCFEVKAGYTEELREEIHILIIGDPGIGKTKLKENALKLAEKGIKASGTNASGVGLTGAVDRDPVLNTPMVNAGAIPMANNGHLFLDECEKMPKEESQKMLDGMESGEIQITKWGLSETLPAHTSILAIGNPVFGRFDPYSTKSINDQLNIYPPLLSRFDLVIALEDIKNEEKDRAIGKSILNKFRPGGNNQEDDGKKRIDPELLQKYLIYARRNYNPVPIEDEELDKFLVDEYYLESREMGKDARSFEAVNRFAGAIAKLQLHDQINVDDYQQAIDIQNFSLKSLGMDPSNVDIDELRGNLNNKDKQHRKEILTVMHDYMHSADNLDADAIPKTVLKETCQDKYNMSSTTFYNAFKQLKNAKEIYEYHKQVYFKH